MKVTINTVDTNPENGDLVVVVTIEPTAASAEETATIIVPELVLEERLSVYRLIRRDEALSAVLKEHAKRLLSLPDTLDSDSITINRMGGLRRDIEIVRSGALVSPEAMQALELEA